MTSPALFRPEVFEARQDAWLGRVQIVQPLSVRLTAGVSVLLIAACVAYTALGSYTRRVHATGMLMPSAGLFAIASPAAGIVTSGAAREGERVRKGQLLYVVNTDATSAAGPAQQQIVAQLKAQRATIATERRLRQQTDVIEKAALANQLANLARQHSELGDQIDIQNQSIPILKAKTDQLHGAVHRHVVTDETYENQLYLYMQALTQLAQFQQSYLQIEGQVADVSSRLAVFDSKAAEELNQLDRNVLQLDAQITESEARRSVEILAPEDGTLTAPRIHAGQQVGAGTELVTLLPSAGKLEAQLFVDSSAIGFIRDGAPVLLRYAAFPFQRFGLHRGVVSEVTRAPVGSLSQSTGSAPGPNGGGQQSDAAAVYRVVVLPNRASVSIGGRPQPLEAGMRVDADISLDHRPLYRWLLDPLYQIDRSASIITGAGAK